MLLFFFKVFIYLFMRDRDRGAETQAEGEAGSMQGARHGTCLLYTSDAADDATAV